MFVRLYSVIAITARILYGNCGINIAGYLWTKSKKFADSFCREEFAGGGEREFEADYSRYIYSFRVLSAARNAYRT